MFLGVFFFFWGGVFGCVWFFFVCFLGVLEEFGVCGLKGVEGFCWSVVYMFKTKTTLKVQRLGEFFLKKTKGEGKIGFVEGFC